MHAWDVGKAPSNTPGFQEMPVFDEAMLNAEVVTATAMEPQAVVAQQEFTDSEKACSWTWEIKELLAYSISSRAHLEGHN